MLHAFPRLKWFKIHLDIPLSLMILGLTSISLMVLYSTHQSCTLLYKQMMRFGISFVLMLGVAQIPPRFFERYASLFYFATLGLLILVLIAGTTTKGAQRWINLGIMRFQPAELMKIALPMMLAHFFHHKYLPPSLKTLFWPLVFMAIPVVCIALQPDLGTAILVASSGVFTVFFAGVSWRLILFSITAGLCSLPVGWTLLRAYQKERILTLLNPEKDPLGKGYHIIQSKIAIGSGGIHGKGWLKGTQASLEFLPERSTDFIFSVFAEAFGLIGALVLLFFFVLLLSRGLSIGVNAQSTFSRLLAGSLTMTIFVYIFVNIGMVCGMLPVVGIPLPLISYGGTSMLTVMIMLGMLMSIKTHRSLLGH